MNARIPVFFALLLTTLATACANPVQPAPGAQMPQLQSFSQRSAQAHQLEWAHDLRDYSPADNPSRVLRVKYNSAGGQGTELYIQYRVKSAWAHVRVSPVSAPGAADLPDQYFDSTNQVRLKELVKTLKSLGLDTANAESKQHLANVIAYLEKAVKP